MFLNIFSRILQYIYYIIGVQKLHTDNRATAFLRLPELLTLHRSRRPVLEEFQHAILVVALILFQIR